MKLIVLGIVTTVFLTACTPAKTPTNSGATDTGVTVTASGTGITVTVQ